MFTKDEMKRKYETQFDRQQNYQNIMNQKEKRSSFVPKLITAMVCAIFAFSLSMPLWNKNKDAAIAHDEAKQEIGPQIVLNINRADESAEDIAPALRADMEAEMMVSTESFVFLEGLCPEGFKASELVRFYATLRDTGEEVTAHYRICYENENQRITLAFSETEWPWRCYYISPEHKMSMIDGVEMDISSQQENGLYLTLFEYGEMYFDVEASGISEHQLVDFLLNLVGKAGEVR